MNATSDPIGFFGKLNAGVLLAVTPEYGKIKAVRRPGAGRAIFPFIPAENLPMPTWR